MNNESADQPLHISAADERKRRGWTQQDAADAAGMSLRAYQEFENGRSKPQSKNRRGILHAFGLDGSAPELPAAPLGDICPECGGVIFPDDVRTFLNMWGAFIMTMPADKRQQFILQETRRVFRSE